MQMLRLFAAAVVRRALVRGDLRVSSLQRLLHLPPSRLLMANDMHVFMHTHKCRMGTGPQVEPEHTDLHAYRASSG